MNNRMAIGTLLAAFCLAGCDVRLTSQPNKTERQPSGGVGEVVVVNDANFDQVVLQSGRPVLVDIWAHGCPPCKQIAPIVKELAGEYDGLAVVAKMDANAAPQTARKYRIQFVPTLLVFKNGQEVSRVEGATSKSDLKARLNQALSQ
jgi:thioredoxin 1